MSKPQEEGWFYVCDCGPENHQSSEDYAYCNGVFVFARSKRNAAYRAKKTKSARLWDNEPYVHQQAQNVLFKRYCVNAHNKVIGKVFEPGCLGKETVTQARFLRDMSWHDGNETGPCDACGLWEWEILPESKYCGNCQVCRECKDEPCEECDQ